MNSNSWRDVAARLEAFAEGHYQIQRFSVGEIGDIDKQQLDATYPLMFAIHPNITPVNGALNYALEIVFVDLARDFEEKGTNQVQVISDLARIALDLISEIKNGTVLFGDEVAVVGNQAQIDTGAQQFNNNLCVARLTFSLEIPFEWNACEIPADYAPGGSGQLPGGGYPSWCDKLIYCPVIIQILADLNNKLEFVSVDGVTIVGDGTPGNPLEAVGGGGGGGSGTVTSIDVTADGDAINPTGGPVTTSGAINLEFNGASTDYIDGEGNLQVFPSIPPTAPVDSVNGQTGVVVLDATDVNAWPLPGTGTGPKANGTIEVDPTFNGDLIKQDDGAGNVAALSFSSTGSAVTHQSPSGSAAASANSGGEALLAAFDNFGNNANFRIVVNTFSDSTLYPVIQTINGKRWNFNGLAAPTLTDDATLGYDVDSGFIHDGTLYICKDATAGAADWQPQGGGSGSTAWGAITGTLSDQTDLQNALNALQAQMWNNVGIVGDFSTSSGTSVLIAGSTSGSLRVAMAANSVYELELDMRVGVTGTALARFGWACPADCEYEVQITGRATSGTAISQAASTFTGPNDSGLNFGTTNSVVNNVRQKLRVITTTAGNFDFLARTSVATSTSVEVFAKSVSLNWRKLS